MVPPYIGSSQMDVSSWTKNLGYMWAEELRICSKAAEFVLKLALGQLKDMACWWPILDAEPTVGKALQRLCIQRFTNSVGCACSTGLAMRRPAGIPKGPRDKWKGWFSHLKLRKPQDDVNFHWIPQGLGVSAPGSQWLTLIKLGTVRAWFVGIHNFPTVPTANPGAVHCDGLCQWSTPSLGCLLCGALDHCSGAAGWYIDGGISRTCLPMVSGGSWMNTQGWTFCFFFGTFLNP